MVKVSIKRGDVLNSPKAGGVHSEKLRGVVIKHAMINLGVNFPRTAPMPGLVEAWVATLEKCTIERSKYTSRKLCE